MQHVARVSAWGQWLALGGVALLIALIGERVGFQWVTRLCVRFTFR